MLGRAISLVVGIGVVGLILILLGVLPNPIGSLSKPKVATKDLIFYLTRDKYGEHTEMSAPIRVSFISTPGLPDRIDLTEKEGAYYGTVTWTALRSQRGETRLKGEVRSGGRSYRVCEFLSRAGDGASTTAERFYPLNNDGTRFRNPDNIDPAIMQALLNGILTEQDALGKTDAPLASKVLASTSLNRAGTKGAAICLAPPGATQR
jgi:hypothetical protein